MNKLFKQVTAFLVAGIIALGGLAACGQPEPASAKDIVDRFAAAANRDNYHADLTMDIDISLFGQAMTMSVKSGTDVAGDDAHGTTELSALGQNATYEVYVTKEGDKVVQYQSDTSKDEKSWVKSTLDSGYFTDSLMTQDILSEGEFAKTDTGYTITVPGEKFLSALSSSGVNLDSMLGNTNNETMKEALKDSKAVYTFDKDCMLTGCTFSAEFDYSYGNNDPDSSSDTAGFSISAGVKMTMNLTISGYGSVDAAKVATPEDVKSAAIDTGTLEESLNQLTNLVNEDSTATETSADDKATAEDTAV